MSEPVHDAQRLKELQALPLWRKVQISQTRIIEFYQKLNGKVCVSFSGGKDSTVLAHLVHQIYPDVPLVFSNTGLEYPEIQKFAKAKGAVFIRPEKMFRDVVSDCGYPIISKEVSNAIYEVRTRDKLGAQYMKFIGESYYKYGKSRYCCDRYIPIYELPIRISSKCCGEMKKTPLHKYQKEHGNFPYVGTLADESMMRKNAWIRHGCNAFNGSKTKSNPMSFWTEQDVLHYIVDNNIEIASVYGDIVDESGTGIQLDINGEYPQDLHCTGCDRTGCMFCGYGMHLERGKTRFQRLAETHPRQYEYSIGGGHWVDNPDYDPTLPKMHGKLIKWNPKQLWMPSEKGLGMGKVFDMCNEAMGKELWRY